MGFVTTFYVVCLRDQLQPSKGLAIYSNGAMSPVIFNNNNRLLANWRKYFFVCFFVFNIFSELYMFYIA